MRFALLAVCAVALAGSAVSSPASAFTQEPLRSGGAGGGSALADPSEQYRNRVDPDAATERRLEPRERSPFSYTGREPWEPRRAAPVERPGVDNEHLFWNNSSRYWR